MSNNNHVIEQIISQADIVKIVGKHTELKRSGNEFKGCCPFHGEKTASFYVNPQKGLYKCFGCGVGGNALTFLKEYEHMTAGEALQELSRQTGIELPKERPNKDHIYKKQPVIPPVQTNQNLPTTQKNLTPTPASPKKNFDSDLVDNFSDSSPINNEQNFILPDSHFQENHYHDTAGEYEPLGNLYDLLEQICQFYQQQLRHNLQALQYLEQRGLTATTIETFLLGYAPTGWQHLEQAFANDIEGLKILGLVRTSQNGRDFDLLRHRVIFPIRDGRGRVVGFAGRALSDEDMPKYINSSDSPVFHKQQILYGLYEGRKAKAERFLVVEGYMDVISLYQAGVYGAVAAMGTALTTTQIDKLLQYNPVLTLSFDGDTAGQKAAWRALEAGLPAVYDGRELRFLTLPKEHDPDSYVRAYGASAMQAEIDKAIPLSEYVFSTLSRRIPIVTAEGRGKLLAELNQLIQKLPKGSYGWLLRDDIRKRMGLGKRQQVKATQDAMLNFNAELTSDLQLQLCLLFQPSILGNTEPSDNQILNNSPLCNSQLIETIYAMAGANAVKLPKKIDPNSPIPKPITWEEICDDNTLQLIRMIQHNQTILETVGGQIHNRDKGHVNEMGVYDNINAKAHFILVGLGATQRAYLAPRWSLFLWELAEREVMDVSDLVMEIVIKLVLDGLQKRLKTQKNIATLQYIKNQSQAIFGWYQAWLEKRENLS